MGHSGFFFYLFSSFQYNWQLGFIINFANDWILTAVLWYRKWTLYQLSHNHCPDLKSFSVIAEPNIRLPLGAVPAKFANKLKVLTRK